MIEARLAVVADRSGRPAHLPEKDVWVVWALSTLFGSDLGHHLVFKGGTSLSKAYGVIRRFSEDVDLTFDIRAIAPDLVGENDEALPKNRSEEKRWSKGVRDRLPEWVDGTVHPLIAGAIRRIPAIPPVTLVLRTRHRCVSTPDVRGCVKAVARSELRALNWRVGLGILS